MNRRPATNPEHALERVRSGLGATNSQKASTRPATYAHHGQIRCYTFTRSTHGPVQRWDAYCACGWRQEDAQSHEVALVYLRRHQRRHDPSHQPLPVEVLEGLINPLDQTPLQRAHRPNGARA